MAPKTLITAAVLLVAFYFYLQGTVLLSLVLFASAMIIAVSYSSAVPVMASPFPDALRSNHSPLKGNEHYRPSPEHLKHGHVSVEEELACIETCDPEFGWTDSNLLDWQKNLLKDQGAMFKIPGAANIVSGMSINPMEGSLDMHLHSHDDPNFPNILIEDDIRIEPKYAKLPGGYDPMKIVKPRWRTRKDLWKTRMFHVFPKAPFGIKKDDEDEHH